VGLDGYCGETCMVFVFALVDLESVVTRSWSLVVNKAQHEKERRQKRAIFVEYCGS
jgi:hypothetical protein